MTAIQHETPNLLSRVGVAWSEGVVHVRDDDLFTAGRGARCVDFLHRVFALSEVERVEFDRAQSSAAIHYDKSRLRMPEFLERLASALRGKLSATAPSPFLLEDLSTTARAVQVQRFGAALTTWSVVHDRPGRLRLRHPALRGDAALAGRLEGSLENLHGVFECAVWPITGSVLIRFDPGMTDRAYLLRVLDQARHTPVSPDHIPAHAHAHAQPTGFILANSSLALAVAGEIAAPILLPACAILLIGSNLQTVRSATRQLLKGKVGLPVLYATIVAATLVSGQFIASATMSWMLIFWSRRYKNDLRNARRRLVGQIIQQPHYVRLATTTADSVNVGVLVDDLKEHDVILVSAGELIPADGRVLHGRGLVDERMVLGLDGLSRKQADDEVCAGSTLLVGELHIEVSRHGVDTQVARLAKITLTASTVPHGARTPTLRGETFAEQTVAPTMAMAGLGLLVGDITTAAAILRPDYATGPGMAFPLETVQAIALCIRHGIVVREADALERLATADLVVIEHHPELDRTELEVDEIKVFPGHDEDELLRYAATAFHDLNDERAGALRAACRRRNIDLLDLQPSEFANDLTLVRENHRIKVGDLGARPRRHTSTNTAVDAKARADRSPAADSLMIGIDGQVAGLIHFQRSDRLIATAALRRLCAKRNLPIGIISEKALASLPALGTDFQVGGLSFDDRIRFLENCRRRGFKVAYVGDCRDPRTVAESHVAISFGDEAATNLDTDSAAICLLQPRIVKLGELWDIASIHRRRLRAAHGYAMIPNIACIAGAFTWGFTSLASVVLTNLGTYCVYARTAASIRSLERHIAESLSTRRAATSPVAECENSPVTSRG
jgi:cation transport ATPase